MQRTARQALTGFTLAVMAALCLPVQAQSLGAEQVLSLLGDPIEVEIAIDNWQELDLRQVQILNATPEQYKAFNLNYLPMMAALNFNVIGPNLAGEVKVLISSREPVREPFLDLLLILRWPQGSSLREYVLLFDPPPELVRVNQPAADPITDEFANALAVESDTDEVLNTAQTTTVSSQRPAVVAPQVAAVPPPTVVQNDVDSSQPTVRTQPAIEVENLSEAQPQTADDTHRSYQVRNGDTLYVVARQFHPAGVGENLYQFLVSLHDLNRQAFLNANISMLKVGAELRIPTTSEIAVINPSTAKQVFEERWTEGTRPSTGAGQGEPIPAFAPLAEPATVAIVEGEANELTPRPLGSELTNVAIDDSSLLAPTTTNTVPMMPLNAGATEPAPGLASASLAPPMPLAQTSTPAATDSVNPYLNDILAKSADVQALLTQRAQRLQALEQQILLLRQQQAPARTSNSSAGSVLARLTQQPAEFWLYGVVALFMLGALAFTVRLALRINAELHKLRV